MIFADKTYIMVRLIKDQYNTLSINSMTYKKRNMNFQKKTQLQ